MTEVVLKIDPKTQDLISNLAHQYGRSQAEIFSKALSLLQIAAYVNQTNGELIARKDNHETKINI